MVAVVDWSAVAAVGALVVALGGSIGTYLLGRRTDRSLNLSKDADRRSSETKTALEAQNQIIDQLQEEVVRHLASLRETQAELEAKRREVRELRRELRDSEVQAAKVITGLETQIVSMQDTISRHERTISLLQSQLDTLSGGGGT